MSIRRTNKDHRRGLATALTVVPSLPVADNRPIPDDPLVFWTGHEKEVAPVDLRLFRTGEKTTDTGVWKQSFSGRPELIAELGPTLKDALFKRSPNTVIATIASLKLWWRLFDVIEAEASAAGRLIKHVESVGDLTEIHRERAYQNMHDRRFRTFGKLADTTRRALGLRRLHWSTPSHSSPVRRIPDQAHTDPIRHALRGGWFVALNRWEEAAWLLGLSDDELKSVQERAIAEITGASEDRQCYLRARQEEQRRLRRNYRRFRDVATASTEIFPSAEAMHGDITMRKFKKLGYRYGDALRGFYPDAVDIRMAFFHCLASTGWNVQVLLDLDATTDFIEILPVLEPKNGENPEPERYLMTGRKARAGGAEVYFEGMTKSRGSPGMVILELIRRTEPLRNQLRKDLERLEKAYAEMNTNGADQAALLRQHSKILEQRQTIRSPWLYADSKTGIAKLKANKIGTTGSSFLGRVVADLNKTRPADDPIPVITPSDFRDIFATYIFRSSGGSIFHVMIALGHAHVQTTLRYTDNNILNAENVKRWHTFQTNFWDQCKQGKVDPTILAKLCRDASASDEEQQRLIDYRALRVSRVGVHCSNPTAPPTHINRNFISDGKKQCVTHRCTLCPENAVLGPNSWKGLSMRAAELLFMQRQYSVVFFETSSYIVELKNTEAALRLYDVCEVQKHIGIWAQRIENGEHRIIDFPAATERPHE